MSQPLIVTQLLLKRAEIEAQINSLNAVLSEARTDLLHVVAVVRLYDPAAAEGKPAGAYHGATKAMRRSVSIGVQSWLWRKLGAAGGESRVTPAA